LSGQAGPCGSRLSQEPRQSARRCGGFGL